MFTLKKRDMVGEMKKSESNDDDLKVIKGIAETRERVLREDLNVHSYQDLAGLEIIIIETLFKERGESVSRELIKGWISEAKSLAKKSSSNNQFKTKNLFQSKLGRKKAKGEDNNWQSVATFIVEYQEHIIKTGGSRNRTTIHYMQKDTGAIWPGYEHLEQCKWMKEKIKELPKSIREPGKTSKDKVFVWIENVFFHQPGVINEDYLEKGIAPTLEDDKPFDIEIHFSIKGESISKLIKKDEVTFQASCMVQNAETGESLNLGSSSHETIAANQVNYQTSIKDVDLRKGEYRFWSVVRLDMNNAVPHFFELPILQVQ